MHGRLRLWNHGYLLALPQALHRLYLPVRAYDAPVVHIRRDLPAPCLVLRPGADPAVVDRRREQRLEDDSFIEEAALVEPPPRILRLFGGALKVARTRISPDQDSLPGIDCGCRPVCRVWERLQTADRLYDRAVSNYVDAKTAWSLHVDQLAQEAA